MAGEPSTATANGIPPSLEGRGDVRVFARSARRRLWADGAARWVVGAGGVAVIASILGILVFLVVEVIPLFAAARVEPARSVPLTGAPPEALLVDEHRSHTAVLGLDGVVRVRRIADGAMVLERPLLPEGGDLASVRASAADSRLLAATDDGRLMLVPVVFAVARVVRPRVPFSRGVWLAMVIRLPRSRRLSAWKPHSFIARNPPSQRFPGDRLCGA